MFKNVFEMKPEEMGNRGSFTKLLLLSMVALYACNRRGESSGLIELDEVENRKGKYEPYTQYLDDSVGIYKSLFSRDDMNAYLSADLLAELPAMTEDELVGVSWLVSEDGITRDTQVLVTHFIRTDKYHVTSSLDGNHQVTTHLDEDPEIDAVLSESGGKILDVMIMPDRSVKVIYKGCSRQDDLMIVNDAGQYVIVGRTE